jgi:hypothetical protein
VGPRAILDTVAKRKIPSPRQESNPRTTMRNENSIWMEMLHTFLFGDNFSLEENLECRKKEDVRHYTYNMYQKAKENDVEDKHLLILM